MAHRSMSIAESVQQSYRSDLDRVLKSHISHFMQLKYPHPDPRWQGRKDSCKVPPAGGASLEDDWREAQAELVSAREALAASPAGIARQMPFDKMLTAD